MKREGNHTLKTLKRLGGEKPKRERINNDIDTVKQVSDAYDKFWKKNRLNPDGSRSGIKRVRPYQRKDKKRALDVHHPCG